MPEAASSSKEGDDDTRESASAAAKPAELSETQLSAFVGAFTAPVFERIRGITGVLAAYTASPRIDTSASCESSSAKAEVSKLPIHELRISVLSSFRGGTFEPRFIIALEHIPTLLGALQI